MAGTISPGLQVGTAPRGDLKAEVARVKPARSHGRSTLEKKKKNGTGSQVFCFYFQLSSQCPSRNWNLRQDFSVHFQRPLCSWDGC